METPVFYFLLDNGHYFVFIYDFYKNIWRRYSDFNVTEVDFSTVRLESEGLYGNCNANYLTYIKEDISLNKNLQNCFYTSS